VASRLFASSTTAAAAVAEFVLRAMIVWSACRLENEYVPRAQARCRRWPCGANSGTGPFLNEPVPEMQKRLISPGVSLGGAKPRR
jgi:hypothetical protein